MRSPAALAPTAPVMVDDHREVDNKREPKDRHAVGDLSEFEAQLDEHRRGLMTRAIRLCRGHLEPEDLVQDTLIRALLARKSLRDPVRMRSWLLSILGNVFIDAMRKKTARPPHVPLDIDLKSELRHEPAERLPSERIGTEEFREAITRLPDDVRDTYRQFALQGKDYIQIATALDIPISTVGTRLFRARKLLRELLAGLLEETP